MLKDIYLLAVGPLAWAAFAIFFFGSIWRLGSMYLLAREKESPFLAFMSWRWGLRSIAHWAIPFGSLGWRESPAVTAVTFVFHGCLLALPFFALGHAAMLDQYRGWGWPSLPGQVSLWMGLAVVLAGLFFGLRRALRPEVRFVTSAQDWVVLALTLAPFLTGLLASQRIGPPLLMTTLHVLAGEALLVAIPFTRLSHMLFGVFSRAYVGSEFGGVRHARDW